MSIDELLHETVVLRTAFADIAHHVCSPRPVDVDTVPLTEVRNGLEGMGIDRVAALLFAYRHTDGMVEAYKLAEEVRGWVIAGKRPRSVQDVLPPEEIEAKLRAVGVERPG
jgi:hypothetical protein